MARCWPKRLAAALGGPEEHEKSRGPQKRGAPMLQIVTQADITSKGRSKARGRKELESPEKEGGKGT